MTTQSITTLILGTAPENATPATHILAGPWCTAPASAEETGFDMPPEPLADPERLETAARQARQLVTQLAPRLRDYLNGLYGTQHDDRYWDFVLAPWLVRAVETLEEPDREILIRRYYREQKPREIAAALGLPVKQVQNRLYRAKRKLRETIDKEGQA